MPNTSELNFLGVVVASFLPMFASAAFLRARGVAGGLAIVGAIGATILVFSSFEGWRLAVGGIAALGGLTLGGYVSDVQERNRLRRLDLEAAARKEELLRRQYSKHE